MYLIDGEIVQWLSLISISLASLLQQKLDNATYLCYLSYNGEYSCASLEQLNILIKYQYQNRETKGEIHSMERVFVLHLL
jgi:hypothetical protein